MSAHLRQSLAPLVLGLALAGCEAQPSLAPSPLASAPNSPLVSVPLPVATSVQPTLAVPRVPSAGGTCSAAQFVLGTPTSGYVFGPVGTNVVDLTQPMRNAGASCLLVLPTVIGVTSAIGPPGLINVAVAPPSSAEVRAGMTLTLGFVAKWPVGYLTAPTSPPAGPRCSDPINEVTRVVIPFASGSITLDLNPIWRQVCRHPASVGLAMTTT